MKIGSQQHHSSAISSSNERVILVRGRDLLELGYPRGPLYSEILHAVETKQLEGELTTPDDALAWVRATYPL